MLSAAGPALTRRRLLASSAAAAALPMLPRRARAAQPVRLGLLRFGTVSWEIDTIRHHGLDRANGIALDVTEFAGEDAAGIALMAGSVDMMVSDWLWVSRERGQGGDLTLLPFSSAIGAIMVPGDSSLKALPDIKGRRIAVAGGPFDKSWLLLRAHAQRDFGFDPQRECEIAHGAPPLLAEKALQGEFDAVLNFWQFCARLEAAGFRRLIGADDAARALGASGSPCVLGYVFHDAWAKANPQSVAGFARASAAAKEILATSDAEWERLHALVRAEGTTLAVLRDRFRQGIPRRPVEAEEADAALLYRVLAEIGGAELVGSGTELAPGTFWRQMPA
jgi:NitT/TauT family transport system substrate-binding protein